MNLAGATFALKRQIKIIQQFIFFPAAKNIQLSCT